MSNSDSRTVLFVTMSTTARDFVLEVIEKYKTLPCLWQVKHPDYHDRNKRNAAMNALLALFKTKDPDANTDTVKKKITSMRNCFKKEHNKVKTSSRSGVGTADIHVPKLWYYSELLFLADVDVPRPSRSVNSILDDMPFEDAEVSNYETEDTASTSVQSPDTESMSQTSTASSSRYRSRKTKAEADNILAKIAKKMDEPNPLQRGKQEYDSFGEHIAEKLRNLPTTMSIYCQKIINDAIFMAETNDLTIDSHIVRTRNSQSQAMISQHNKNLETTIQPREIQISQTTNDHNILYEAFVAAMGETPE